MERIILTLLCVLVVCKNSYSQVQYLTFNPEDNNLPVTYFDCSYSSKCWSVNSCLLLRCDTMYKLRDTFFVEYGLKSKFRGYRIESPITLQTSCNGTSIAGMDTFVFLYDIYIAEQNHEEYLDLMIDSLYREILPQKENLESNFNFWRNNYFLYDKGNFLFYNFTSYYLIHFNGFLIKVMCAEGKVEANSAGLKTFMSQVCNFRGDDYMNFFEGKTSPTIHPLDFIIWYEAGKFKR